jgi:hypothetical protein
MKSIDTDPYARYTIRSGLNSLYGLYRDTLVLAYISYTLTTSSTFRFNLGNK